MKKKLFLILCFFILASNCFSQEKDRNDSLPKMDLDFKIYLPSLLGHVTGDNPFLGLRENTDVVDSCTNFMVETRGSIISTEKITFNWCFGVGAYIENNKIHSDDLLSIDLSLGAGFYWHIFDLQHLL